MKGLFFDLYQDGGCGDVPAYVCDNCPDAEAGRVSAVAFVTKSYLDNTLIGNFSDLTKWTAGVSSGDIILIPECSGSYDGGSPTFGAGYGRKSQRLLGSEHKCTFTDANYLANESVYAALEVSGKWVCVMFTETLGHVANQPTSMFAKKEIKDDLKSEVVGIVECAWTEKAGAKAWAYVYPAGLLVC